MFKLPESSKKLVPAHHTGHRQRLRERIISTSGTSLLDYELLEAALFAAIPRRDVKPIAKNLLTKFGSLQRLLYADKNSVIEVDGMTMSAYAQLLVIKEIMTRSLKEKIAKKNIISSWSSLIDYLKISMDSLKREQFRIIFLNKKNMLIADEILSEGTVDQTAVYPREIVKKALFYEASAIILVHNHPSGDFQPSKSDVMITDKISSICSSVNIAVHDHVIIAGGKYFSFKSNALL